MPCDLLQGCAKTYCCNPLRQPIDDHVLAPYVIITVKGQGNTITVGNKSNPARNNHAVVKSFKYGSTAGDGGGGLKMDVEIADEAGGSFATFISKIISIQDFQKITDSFWINAKWGWIGAKCPGDNIYPATEHTMGLKKVTCNFQHGLLKFTLEGIDVTATAFEAAADRNHGTDNNPIPLKQAIIDLCNTHKTDVFFWKPHTHQTWEFLDPATKDGKGDPNRPKGVWRENSQNFIQTIMNWCAPYTTTDKKGITPSFNSKRKPGTREQLILWEGFAGRCDEIVNPCDPITNLGTYVVNGGKRSPVISFNPQWDWHFGNINQSGGDSSKVANQQKQESGIPNCFFGGPQEVQRGLPTFNPVTDDAVRVYGTKRALIDTQDAVAQQARANISTTAIKAELKIQGNPFFADPINLTGKFCSVIVINPFHIQSGVGGGICGDWLQAEPCNSILSNRAYLVMGSYHEIKEGSYTTTLKLHLPAPGVDIGVGLPLGGDPLAPKIN